MRDPADPALAVVQRLEAEFPSLPIDVVVNPQLHGSNYKIGNLINMLERARHDVLIIADSDTFVAPDYLACVTAPLNDRNVGLVTCVYEDVPTKGIWSRLGAMYINEWYIPSALLAALFGHRNYASGQTLCLRRQTLSALGGFAVMANHLADDYRLGELIRGLGLRIELSPTVVMAEHDEPSLDCLTRHELRWMRTIRALRPRSFRVMFLSFLLPMACCGLLLCRSRFGHLDAGVVAVRHGRRRSAGAAFRASNSEPASAILRPLAGAAARPVAMLDLAAKFLHHPCHLAWRRI